MIAFNKITDFVFVTKFLTNLSSRLMYKILLKNISDIGQIFVKIRIRRNLINKYYSINKC